MHYIRADGVMACSEAVIRSSLGASYLGLNLLLLSMSGRGRSETKGLESVKVIGCIFPLNDNEAQSINLSRILRK
jgi:hypothetical protein